MLSFGNNEKLAERLDLSFSAKILAQRPAGTPQYDQYGRVIPLGRAPPVGAVGRPQSAAVNNQLNSQLYSSYSSTAAG